MALITNAIKGTQDALPNEIYKTQYVENAMRETAENFGFREMRTPVFEHTELFQRGVGETTDVVQKEMYTFLDKGGRSITLRPEGTAGAVRAFLEHGLFNEALPQKIYYLTSCYRYEKPQAGRLREFHQFGIECFGAGEPSADAEAISLANEIFNYLGIEGLSLEINSIGCPECRKEYHKALREYFAKYENELCDTCKGRLERNPMRILDCKSSVCSEIAENAPVVLDYLCGECKAHFDGVKKYLDAMNIGYKVNPQIVRGLDYYTRTVFEFVSNEIGAQGTVCGGGRYDGLIGEMGGNPLPACGFGMGIERLLLLMDKKNSQFPEPRKTDLYIVSLGESASLAASSLAKSLREEGFCVQFDTMGRGFKAQMKYANKIGASYALVLGDNELETGNVKLKNMTNGKELEMTLDSFSDDFQSAVIKDVTADFESLGLELDEETLSALTGGNE